MPPPTDARLLPLLVLLLVSGVARAQAVTGAPSLPWEWPAAQDAAGAAPVPGREAAPGALLPVPVWPFDAPGAATPAPSRSSGPAPGSRAAEALAREQSGRARVSYDVGDFAEALAAYSEAYRLLPRPAFLFNIAQCHRQLGQWERAAFFYRRYLEASAPRPANAKLVAQLLEEVEARERAEAERREAALAAERERERERALPALGLAPAEQAPAAAGLTQVFSASPTPPGPPAVAPARPLWKRWWVWAGVGAAAAAAGGVAWAASSSDPKQPSLGTIGAR